MPLLAFTSWTGRLASAIVGASAPASTARLRMPSEMSDWTEHVALFGVVVGGERVVGPVMRRRTPAGRWEYRRMTADELADWLSREAW